MTNLEALFEPSDEEILLEPSDSPTSDDETDEDSYSKENKRETIRPLRDDEFSDLEASASGEDDETEGWGASKEDYYDADPIETEADALAEEAEARRLQQKQLQGMTEADFGLDEIDWAQAGKTWDGKERDGTRRSKVVTEVLPPIEITTSMSPEERLNILKMQYPEFEPLAKEYVGLQGRYDDLALASEAAESFKFRGTRASDDRMPMATAKFNALRAYLAALCMYFAIFTSGRPDTNGNSTLVPPTELQDHSIMDILVQCRSLWGKFKDITIPEPQALPKPSQSFHNGVSKVENGPSADVAPPSPQPEKSRRPRKSASQRAAQSALADSLARRNARIQEAEASLADLDDLLPFPRAKSSDHPATDNHKKANAAYDEDDDKNNSSDLGEDTATPPDPKEAAAKRKSLRFYTSQIVQKAKKRGAAGKEAGGDMDVPYKERWKDRQERLTREAEERGKKTAKDDDSSRLDAPGVNAAGGRSDEEEEMVNGEKEDEDGEEDYYDFMSKRHAEKKAAKRAAAEAVAAARDPLTRVEDGEALGEDGKRKVSYAIEKNKGVAPRRQKTVRNPRVKKRMKYQDKMKKLGSLRPVYKGGEERGGYGGERTGIKTGLVRSVKL